MLVCDNTWSWHCCVFVCLSFTVTGRVTVGINLWNQCVSWFLPKPHSEQWRKLQRQVKYVECAKPQEISADKAAWCSKPRHSWGGISYREWSAEGTEKGIWSPSTWSISWDINLRQRHWWQWKWSDAVKKDYMYTASVKEGKTFLKNVGFGVSANATAPTVKTEASRSDKSAGKDWWWGGGGGGLGWSLSPVDGKVLSLWQNELRREDEHHVLPIPWRNYRPDFPYNVFVAKHRLKSLESQLDQTDLRENYKDILMKMMSDYSAHNVTSITPAGQGLSWYNSKDLPLPENSNAFVCSALRACLGLRALNLNQIPPLCPLKVR